MVKDMVTEERVSFETAKLLDEKGWAIACHAAYLVNDDKVELIYPEDEEEFDYCAPTLQMTMNWLRVLHHIFVQIELYSKYDDYTYDIFQNTHRLMLEKRETFSTPEEAADSAIKYCLIHLL